MIDWKHVEIHRSAYKHGLSIDEIRHALNNAVTVHPLEPDTDPPKELLIGPDFAGNPLELIWLRLPGDRLMLIHAMRLRRSYRRLLPPAGMRL